MKDLSVAQETTGSTGTEAQELIDSAALDGLVPKVRLTSLLPF